MKLAEIEIYRQDLRNILNMEDENQRCQELVQLAKKVGAGYIHSKIAGATRTEDSIRYTIDQISEAELVLNINNALQTETMINALKTANRSWVVAVIAALISLGSIIAVILKMY
ncbi:MAG: hypothetical protein ACYSWW_05220 [Planctomycetota bacterium]